MSLSLVVEVTKMSLTQLAPSIDDLRVVMEKRVPPVVREYFRGGADRQQTLRDNEEAFQRTRFNPRYAVRIDEVDLSTEILNQKISMPVIGAPVGSLRLLWPKGEAVSAKAIGDAGTIFALSTLSGTRLEEAKNASNGPGWYQLYLVGGRSTALRAIERAKEAGYSALVLTIDTPVAGNRVTHARMKPMEAFAGTLLQKARFVPQMMTRLSWVTSFFADGGTMEFPNIVLNDGSNMQYADIASQLKQSAVTWDDIAWIRQAWGDEPLVIKGIHNIEDAKLAEEYGARAIVISNHGGRQLDRVWPTLRMLQEIAPEMKNSSMNILLDGGVRSGADVAIALATGADAVLVGRAQAYGLGAAGEAGVARAFEILRTELEDTLRQLGCSSVRDLGLQHLKSHPFE
jgi:L-lactate dehydrogenase (cytochrome)